MAKQSADVLMQVLEEASQAVATFTGIKQQFVEAGWNEKNAECAVIAMMKSATN